MINRLVAATRFLTLFPVVAIFVGAAALLVYTTVLTLVQLFDLLEPRNLSIKVAKALMLALINVVDLYLIAIVLFIIAIGLFQLFIRQLTLPAVLHVDTLEQLKEKLVGVIVVVLAVFFLGELGEATLNLDTRPEAIEIAAPIAIVIVALTAFLMQQGLRSPDHAAPARDRPPEE